MVNKAYLLIVSITISCSAATEVVTEKCNITGVLEDGALKLDLDGFCKCAGYPEKDTGLVLSEPCSAPVMTPSVGHVGISVGILCGCAGYLTKDGIVPTYIAEKIVETKTSHEKVDELVKTEKIVPPHEKDEHEPSVKNETAPSITEKKEDTPEAIKILPPNKTEAIVVAPAKEKEEVMASLKEGEKIVASPEKKDKVESALKEDEAPIKKGEDEKKTEVEPPAKNVEEETDPPEKEEEIVPSPKKEEEVESPSKNEGIVTPIETKDEDVSPHKKEDEVVTVIAKKEEDVPVVTKEELPKKTKEIEHSLKEEEPEPSLEKKEVEAPPRKKDEDSPEAKKMEGNKTKFEMGPVSDRTKNEMSTAKVLVILFTALVLGLLVVFVSKMMFKHFKSKTYDVGRRENTVELGRTNGC